MSMDLSTDETTLLAKILTNYLGDLRMEVAGTDAMDYREKLKREEEMIKTLLRRLGSPV